MSFIRNSSLRVFQNVATVLRCTGKFDASSRLCLQSRSIHLSEIYNADGLLLKMPSLSPTMEEGKIVKWLKQEGDPVQPGDVLCDIETDKAVVSMETEEEGTLAKILIDEGAGSIKVGSLIAVLAPEGEDWKTITVPEDTEAAPASADAPAVSAAAATTPTATETGARLYGPSVRLLLQEYGLDNTVVAGSGPHGALLKGDILEHIKRAGLTKVPQKAAGVPESSSEPSAVTPKPSPPTQGLPPYIDIEVTGMRRTIAKRLSESKSSIAHSYGTLECKVDELNALRQQMKKNGANVSVNDLLIKAVGVALKACPAVNSVWKNNQIVVSPTVDISIAVATPSGLITPIITDVPNKGIKSISSTMRDLASRAKQNKLKPSEFQGGSFTISNLGMMGIKEFTAIINPPQCAILAVGAGRVLPGPDGFPETRMRATLSYDRLAIEDHIAAEFLSTLTEVIEKPRELLLGGVTVPTSAIPVEHPLAALL